MVASRYRASCALLVPYNDTHTQNKQVVTDEEGRSRGFGFVHFDSEASATGCINDVNGKIIGGQEVCMCFVCVCRVRVCVCVCHVRMCVCVCVCLSVVG